MINDTNIIMESNDGDQALVALPMIFLGTRDPEVFGM